MVGLDEGLAHLVEGSMDGFLRLSGYKPCGLKGMYGVRSGAAPVVRATGGLADAVAGFVFVPDGVDGMVDAKDAAPEVYRQPDRWRMLQRAGMRQDFFRDVSAAT